MKRRDEHVALRDAVIVVSSGLDDIMRRLSLRVVSPSDAAVLAQWIRNAGEHLKSANNLLEGLPKKSA